MTDASPAATPHFDGEKFRNVHARASRGRGSLLGWMLHRTPAPWPPWIDDPPYPPPAPPPPGGVAVTFIGHATFLLQLGGVALLTDPIWSTRASPLFFAGPRRVRRPGLPLAALPPIDIVALSHCHYDHLDLPTLARLRRRDRPDVVAPLGHRALLAHAGMRRVAELDWWQSVEIRGLRFTAVPACHFSARTLADRNRRLWCGFVVEAPGATVLFAGDSGDGSHWAEIAARFPRIDLALLPIGAYAPRAIMAPVHMDPGEAVEAHRTLGARASLGMHFGTFAGLTDEPIDEPPRKLAEAAAAAGLEPGSFTVLGFGETRVF